MRHSRIACGLTRDRCGRISAAFSSETFDFVYTVNVLEHIEALDETCAELLRVLRPGRNLFVFVPAHKILWTSLDDEVRHVRRFSRHSPKLALERAGFRIEEMRHFDCLGVPAALGVRVLESVNLFSYGGGTVGFYDRFLFPISQQLDRLFNGWMGKNLIAVVKRPAEHPQPTLSCQNDD